MAALALAACGSSDKAEYKHELAAVGRIVDRSLEQIPEDEISTATPADLRRIASDLRKAVRKLNELDPPEGLEKAQKQLGSGMEGVANAYETFADDLENAQEDTDKAEVFVRFVNDPKVEIAFDRIEAAQELYSKRGYRVFRTKSVRTKKRDSS